MPGPGTYNDDKASEAKMGGFYVSSRYRSPGGIMISRNGERFDNSAYKRSGAIPGPGNYNDRAWLATRQG